jgi:hypothetical protein
MCREDYIYETNKRNAWNRAHYSLLFNHTIGGGDGGGSGLCAEQYMA